MELSKPPFDELADHPVQTAARDEIVPLALEHIPDSAIRSLVQDMNQSGVSVLRNYIQPADLQRLQKFVEDTVDAAGGEYVGFDGKEKLQGTLLGELGGQPEFLSLMHRVYEQGSGSLAPKQSIYQVLRCLKGKSGLKHSLMFHYDSYVVTALLPIIIPTEGNAGHLVMAPNWRKLRSSYILNMLDKVLLDNRITQSLLRYAFNTGRLGLKQIAMVPGNLYLFWGYRAIHANEACDPDKIRATALFHFADPHMDSGLRQFTGRAKARAAAEAASAGK
jgi:hypothetical protein